MQESKPLTRAWWEQTDSSKEELRKRLEKTKKKNRVCAAFADQKAQVARNDEVVNNAGNMGERGTEIQHAACMHIVGKPEQAAENVEDGCGVRHRT